MLFNFFLNITNVNKNFNVNTITPICGKNENLPDFFLFLIEKKSHLIIKEMIFFNFKF